MCGFFGNYVGAFVIRVLVFTVFYIVLLCFCFISFMYIYSYLFLVQGLLPLSENSIAINKNNYSNNNNSSSNNNNNNNKVVFAIITSL